MTNMEYYMAFCLSNLGFKCQVAFLFCTTKNHKRNKRKKFMLLFLIRKNVPSKYGQFHKKTRCDFIKL